MEIRNRSRIGVIDVCTFLEHAWQWPVCPAREKIVIFEQITVLKHQQQYDNNPTKQEISFQL